MGNQALRHAAILLPPEFNPQKKYVSLWFLDGYLGNGFSLLKDTGPIGESFGDLLLRIQFQGLCQPFISVFPDFSTSLGGCQYINSLSHGPFQDHFVEELIPAFEKEYPTFGCADGRAILGHSSGGYGAFMMALKKPGYFSYVVASALDSAFDTSLFSEFPKASLVLNKDGGIDGFLKRFFSQKNIKLSGSDFTTLMIIAMASCYSPEIGENAAHARLPFNPLDMTLNQEIWSLWLEHDPVEAIKTQAQHLLRLKHLHLDCGSQDECGAQFGQRRIKKLLDEKLIPCLATEFNGGHYGTQHRYEERIGLLSKALRTHAPRDTPSP